MTDDQQLVWDLLSARYARISHAWGQELQELSKRPSKKRFHAQADQYLSATLAWPVEDRARAVKTWLTTYQIPMDPRFMPHMDQFHMTTGMFVFQNVRQIAVYEKPSLDLKHKI